MDLIHVKMSDILLDDKTLSRLVRYQFKLCFKFSFFVRKPLLRCGIKMRTKRKNTSSMFLKIIFNLPSIWQPIPEYPIGHKQENDVPIFKHIPPFMHGSLAHGTKLD